MRIFLDTEFIENGKTIELLSIGLVREDGAELYLENAEADLSQASPWVRAHVLPHLYRGEELQLSRGPRRTRAEIAQAMLAFVGAEPEFWGYYADYDWVVVCQLYGTMMDLPKGWPMFCRDLQQLVLERGNPTLPGQTGDDHHALNDARWMRDAWREIDRQSRPVGAAR